MSRLDFVTIAIVVICIAALIFLIYKTTNLMGNRGHSTDPPRNTLAEENGEPPAEDTHPGPGSSQDINGRDDQEPVEDDDLDDDELPVVDEEEFLEEEATYDENSGNTAVAEERPVTVDFSTVPSGNYLVIAGSFRLRGNADMEVNRLKKLGYEDAAVTIFNKGSYATVLVQRFESPAPAEDLVEELKSKHNIEAYVQRKRQ